MSDIFDTISKSSSKALKVIETKLQNDVKGGELTMESLMQFQVRMNKWNIISQVGSSVIKATGDAMKGIIQRVN